MPLLLNFIELSENPGLQSSVGKKTKPIELEDGARGAHTESSSEGGYLETLKQKSSKKTSTSLSGSN